MFLIHWKWKVVLYKPNIRRILRTIKSSSDIFINELTPNLYNSFSTLLLGFTGGNIAVGKLDAGTKFVSIGLKMMEMLFRVMFPFLSRKIDKHKDFAKWSVLLSVLLSCFLFLTAPFLLKTLFTEEFNDAIVVLQILSFSVLFLTLSSVYGTNYLIIKGYEKKLRNITFVCSIIGFGISIPLVYYFSYIGAALTISITRGLLGFSIMYHAKKI